MSSDYNLRAGLGPYRHGVLNDGTQKEIHVVNMRAPFTVWVEPTGGDEVTVWVKNAADSAPQLWPDGPVTAATTGVVFGPVFSFIFQRTGGSGTTSKFGVNI